MRISKPALMDFLDRTRWTLVFFLPLILLIAVTQKLEEYFPFSHFPMYDGMSSETFYVYITDGEDNPLPSMDVIGERVSKLKRIYDTELRRIRNALSKEERKSKYEFTIEERSPASRHTLEWCIDTAMAKEASRKKLQEHESIRLYQAMVLMRDGKVVQPPPELVGEIQVPATTTN